MQAFISAHGGIVATCLIAVSSFNIAMKGINDICNQLKIKEPSALTKAASIGATISSWLSANTTPKKK